LHAPLAKELSKAIITGQLSERRLGQFLIRILTGHFQNDLAWMLRLLIDEHPAGRAIARRYGRPKPIFLTMVYMTVAGARRFQGIRPQSLYIKDQPRGQFMYLTVSKRLMILAVTCIGSAELNAFPTDSCRISSLRLRPLSSVGTAEQVKNISAVSGVAYRKLGAPTSVCWLLCDRSGLQDCNRLPPQTIWMFWTVRGANAILAPRCCHLNRRFEDYLEGRRAA